MLDYRELDRLDQMGRGLGASFTGQTYDVFRLNPRSHGSVLNDANRIARNFKITMEKTAQASAIEVTPVYDMIYAGQCDATFLRVGDVVAVTGNYRNDSAMYTVAQLRPSGLNIFVRTEIQGQISRPWGEGDSETYMGFAEEQTTAKRDERPYILRDGFYYIEQGSPAVVPFGLQPYKRLGPSPRVTQPSTTHRTEMFAWVPLLRGVYIEPGDLLTDQNGNRYQIHTVSSYTAGLQGYQLISESVYT